jgi:hypothetical protein
MWQFSLNFSNIGKRNLYTKGEIIQKTITQQDNRNSKQHNKQEIKHKRILKKHKLAVTRVLTEQERRGKWQQCQTEYSAVQYSAVHGAGCVGRLSKR